MNHDREEDVSNKSSSAGREHDGISILGWIRICLVGFTIFATSCSMGLQGILSIPFATKMGLSEALSSLIWLCGPITGMVVQPIIGRWSDAYVSKGMRRTRAPFLVTGAIILSLSTIIIGYAVEIGELLGDKGKCCSSHTAGLVIFIIIFWVYDSAANVVMVVSRSGLVDISPPQQVSTGFFTQTFISELGGLCAGVIASQNWSKASAINLGSDICPRECPPEGCPAGYVAGCYGLRFVVLIDAYIVLVTAAVAVAAMKIGRPAANGRYSAVPMSDEEHNDRPHYPFADCAALWREVRAAPRAYRTVLWAMGLSWFGWFTASIYRSHFVAVEVLPNPFDDDKVYESNLQLAARGMFYGSILSASTSLLFFLLGVYPPHFINPRLWLIWGVSLVWFAALLLFSIFFATKVLPGTVAGVQVWLALVGPAGALSMTIPFALTGRIAQRARGASVKPGTYMGTLNLAICLPQVFVAILGGPFNALVGSDAASFAVGGAGALAAAALVLRRKYWYDSSDTEGATR
ncbi:hypothetical protein FOL47_009441 [Perkinsus chesapeaki]|uniref:Uncharacterized protein n=1 Tax=Perkinsus chesapeaki TaxID=330153 RepID=A0A7J6MSW1_PERCH|nr:hypothetical protein FOL47_009441 [Perkinsus chesapeaki]